MPFHSYCNNIANGTILPISACNQYFARCNAQIMVLSRCAGNRVFVPNKGCVEATSVSLCRSTVFRPSTEEGSGLIAVQRVIESDQFCSDIPNGIYMPRASRCPQHIVMCVANRGRVVVCPPNHYFDEQSRYCKSFSANMACQKDANVGQNNLLLSLADYSCQRTDSAAGLSRKCSQWYIECSSSSRSIHFCQKGNAYDAVQKRCVPSSSCGVSTQSSRLSAICQNRKQSMIAVLPCSQLYAVCLNGQAYPQTCVEKDVFSEKQQSCISFKDHSLCNGSVRSASARLQVCLQLGNVKFAFGACSRAYIQCDKGIASYNLCPENTIFVDSLNSCSNAQFHSTCHLDVDVVTYKRQKRFNNPCFGQPNGLYAVTACSPNYLVCLYQRPSWHTCEKGKTFSKELQSCVDASQNRWCASMPTTPPTPVSHWPDPCTGRADGFFMKLTCSRYWISCKKYKLVVNSCGNSLVYDVVKKRCVKQTVQQVTCTTPASDFTSNPCLRERNRLVGIGACERLYYACFNSATYWQVCPEHEVFDLRKEMCVPRKTVVQCNEPAPCPTPAAVRCTVHGEFLPDRHDRTKFYRCAYGKAVQMKCPPATVFNPAINVCDWPSNVF
ncbi:unnamed protein product [Soboliphyme baturini]|uniref:Chitin-binding type-2 domain-containing protein n=1 Tax=Soboliphyme baturini TaxID=241478 RepID=A0A183II27_9BILA|nr:unnamed protein product [Soboliphyme baturini]